MLALADGTSMDELTFVDVVGLLDPPQTSCLSSVAMCRYGLLLHKSYIVWSACAAVLALAYGTSMDELTFVGVVGLLDPPRDGIQDAVLTLLSTGAHLKMVTGDAEETALAIGKPHTHTHTLAVFCEHNQASCSRRKMHSYTACEGC